MPSPLGRPSKGGVKSLLGENFELAETLLTFLFKLPHIFVLQQLLNMEGPSSFPLFTLVDPFGLFQSMQVDRNHLRFL